MKKTLQRAAAAAFALTGVAQASDFNAIGTLNQTEFRAFSEDVASAVSYKGMMPAAGSGITGFDVGVFGAATEVAHRDVLRKAAGGASVPKSVPVAGVRFVKGLPFDIDVGVVSTQLPSTNVRATGGELRWAVVGGGLTIPAIAIRLSGMQLSGVNQLKMSTYGADISISKGFLFLTPYAGLGGVAVRSRAPGTTLKDEKFDMSRAFVGLKIGMGLANFVVEGDKTGDATTWGLKFSLGW
ncbi:MAG: hypothetical protein RJA10_4442 [Pseudomonadota bacterium]